MSFGFAEHEVRRQRETITFRGGAEQCQFLPNPARYRGRFHARVRGQDIDGLEPLFGWEPGQPLTHRCPAARDARQRGARLRPKRRVKGQHVVDQRARARCRLWRAGRPPYLATAESDDPRTFVREVGAVEIFHYGTREPWPDAPDALATKLRRLASPKRAHGRDARATRRDGRGTRNHGKRE